MSTAKEWGLDEPEQPRRKPSPAERREQEIRNRLLRACVLSVSDHVHIEHGPVALAAFDAAKLASLVKAPALQRPFDPLRDGGRAVLGPTGLGKTSFGMLVLRRILEAQYDAEEAAGDDFWKRQAVRRQGISVMCVGAHHLPSAVLQTGLGKGEPELVAEAVNAGFLVLDDMGWESRRAGAADVVVEVLARRYDAGRVTFVTSGKRLDEFIATYGEAVVRRICEAGGKPGRVIDLWPKGGSCG